MVALNTIPFKSYDYGLDLNPLSVFAFGSLVIILALLFYYNRIPKSNTPKDKLQSPIYQSRDLLLQSKPENTHLLLPDKTTSIRVKVFIFVIIFVVAITPLYQLLGVEYFV